MIDVVLPCLDEAEALPWVLEQMPPDFRPIVVDNGSTDGSGDLARRLGATVVDEPVPGFGSACAAGLAASDATIVCFMDCDATLDPQQLHRVVVPLMDGAHLVLGRRRGDWPLTSRLANVELSRRVRRATGLTLHDLGPMRAARRDDLVSLGITDRRSGWPLEMVLRASAHGWDVREVDVDYRPRTGRSKVTGTVRGALGAVRDMRAALDTHGRQAW